VTGFALPSHALSGEKSPTEQSNKIYLKDFDIEENEHFVKYVFIPYFKDIYRDLAERSDKKAKGINRIIFVEVCYLSLS
jgi:hypothetical protein